MGAEVRFKIQDKNEFADKLALKLGVSLVDSASGSPVSHGQLRAELLDLQGQVVAQHEFTVGRTGAAEVHAIFDIAEMRDATACRLRVALTDDPTSAAIVDIIREQVQQTQTTLPPPENPSESPWIDEINTFIERTADLLVPDDQGPLSRITKIMAQAIRSVGPSPTIALQRLQEGFQLVERMAPHFTSFTAWPLGDRNIPQKMQVEIERKMYEALKLDELTHLLDQLYALSGRSSHLFPTNNHHLKQMTAFRNGILKDLEQSYTQPRRITHVPYTNPESGTTVLVTAPYKEGVAQGRGQVFNKVHDPHAHLPGRQVYPPTRTHDGEFENGLLIRGFQIDPSGQIIGKGEFLNGELEGPGIKLVNGKVFKGRLSLGEPDVGKLFYVASPKLASSPTARDPYGVAIQPQGNYSYLCNEGHFRNGVLARGKAYYLGKKHRIEPLQDDGQYDAGPEIDHAPAGGEEGEFVNGLLHGDGRRLKDGKVYLGEFNQGILVKGKIENPHICIEGEFTEDPRNKGNSLLHGEGKSILTEAPSLDQIENFLHIVEAGTFERGILTRGTKIQGNLRGKIRAIKQTVDGQNGVAQFEHINGTIIGLEVIDYYSQHSRLSLKLVDGREFEFTTRRGEWSGQRSFPTSEYQGSMVRYLAPTTTAKRYHVDPFDPELYQHLPDDFGTSVTQEAGNFSGHLLVSGVALTELDDGTKVYRIGAFSRWQRFPGNPNPHLRQQTDYGLLLGYEARIAPNARGKTTAQMVCGGKKTNRQAQSNRPDIIKSIEHHFQEGWKAADAAGAKLPNISIS